eukprot:5831464-Amphidinium_carterae.1
MASLPRAKSEEAAQQDDLMDLPQRGCSGAPEREKLHLREVALESPCASETCSLDSLFAPT